MFWCILINLVIFLPLSLFCCKVEIGIIYLMHVKIAMVFDILGEPLKKISLFPTMNNFPLKYTVENVRNEDIAHIIVSAYLSIQFISHHFCSVLMLGFSVTV